MIIKYANNVFTHEGQSTVKDFGDEIMKAKDKLLAAKPELKVYAGYHGDLNGEFHHEFTDDEWKLTEQIAKAFSNVKLIRVKHPGMTEDDIKSAVKAGNVFFTWCDSDKKVYELMEEKIQNTREELR